MNRTISKKQIGIISVITVVAVIGLIFGAMSISKKQEQKAIEAIKTEYSKTIDANIAEYLGRSYEDQSYEQREFLIKDVTYEVTDIHKEKENNLHIISVAAHVKCDYTALDDTDCYLISHDVMYGIFRLAKKDGLAGKFPIAGYTCCYRPSGNFTSDGNGFVIRDEQITVYINDNLGSAPEETEVDISNDKDAVKCESCGNKYKKGSDNAKSITRTNMCKSCYGSYKSMSDALNEVPVN